MIGELYTILWQRSGSAEWFPLTARVERIAIWKSVEAAQKALDEDRLLAEAVPHGVEKIEIFPLNSPEAFQAIFGEPGIQFEEEPREVAMSRFQFAAEPLMRYLAQTVHPHPTAIVTSTDAQLFEGVRSHVTDKFLVD